MTRSDVQLMLDVRAGDDASFDFLLQKYRSPLVDFLYRMVRDTATAEDLAQEVFLRVYRARKQETALHNPRFMQGLSPDEQSVLRDLNSLRNPPTE